MLDEEDLATDDLMPFFRTFTAVVSLSIGLLASPASAESYKLQPGDVLAFSVLGANRIDQRVAVDLDGRIRVPVGGQFTAAGRTIDELHTEIVSKLKTGSFPLGTDAGGRTVWDAIFPEAIILDIAEYRPVYISGDVLNPGSQPFRSGTTVRQAISMAGGASPFRSRQDPTLELLGTDAEFRSLLVKEIGAEFALARIHAELDGDDQPNFSAIAETGLDPAKRAELEQTEQETFDARTRDLVQEQETINLAIKSIETRRSLLAKSQANLEAETKIYEDEAKRTEGLYSKGLVQVGRLNDARRALLLVSTRSLDTSAEVARLERESFEMRRNLEKSVSEQKAENLRNLKSTTVELAATRADLERMRQRLEYYMPREEMPTLEIVRSQEGKSEPIAATLDMPIWPGDTLLVKLNAAQAESAGGGRDPSSTVARGEQGSAPQLATP